MEKIESQSGQMRQEVFSKLRNARGADFGLRMTPMIDMIFLLLIFFLLTAKFRPEEDHLPMILPSVESAGAASMLVDPLAIKLTSVSNGVSINIGDVEEVIVANDSVETDLAVFANSINAVLNQQGRSSFDPIELECDEELSWDHLVKVYNILYGLGITDITFPVAQ